MRRGASRSRCVIRPTQAVAHGNMASGNVKDHFRNKEWVETRAAVTAGKTCDFIQEGFQAPDPRSPYHANAIGIQFTEIDPQILYRFLCGSDGVLRKRVQLARFFSVKIILRIKVLYFTSKLCFEPGSIKTGYLGSATNPFLQSVPIGWNGTTDWGECTKPSNYNSFQLHSIPLKRFLLLNVFLEIFDCLSHRLDRFSLLIGN